VLIQNEPAGSDLGKTLIHEDLFSSILLRNIHCRRELFPLRDLVRCIFKTLNLLAKSLKEADQLSFVLLS
jgi:hypothetical protein